MYISLKVKEDIYNYISQSKKIYPIHKDIFGEKRGISINERSLIILNKI